MQTLKEQCLHDIDTIQASTGATGCQAHPAFAGGLVTLLRCQVARLSSDEREYTHNNRIAALIGTAAGAVAAAIYNFFGK